MPIGKTARIQLADKQFGKHLNQIKRICENELHRETRCLEEVYRLEMVQHQFRHKQAVSLLERIKRISHRRDAVMKRSFEKILQKFSFSSVYDSDTTLPPVEGIPKHKLPPKTAPELKNKLAESQQNITRPISVMPNLYKSHSKKTPAATSSWKKIKVTLPRCEADDLMDNRNPLTKTSIEFQHSTNSLMGLTLRMRKAQEISGFMLPAIVATKPMPRARDRYLQSLQQKVPLLDIRECAYLRISADLRAH